MKICPVCAGDRDADLGPALALMRQIGRSGGTHNPGGFLLLFADGHTLQLDAQCNSCDIAKMVAHAAGAGVSYATMKSAAGF